MIFVLINIIPAILLTLITQVILHECGHFLFGRLTGWRFLYLQIYKWVIRKTSHGLEFVKIDAPSFQCIMYPVKPDEGALLYTAGGWIINLVCALAGLMGMYVSLANPVALTYYWCFFAFGMMLFTVNVIPNTKRICNDGACYHLLKHEALTKHSHNQQLLIAKELLEEKTYSEIGKDLICITNKADNDILAYQKILEYYYWIDKEDYDNASKAIFSIVDNKVISKNIWNIICMERVYINLLQTFLLGRTGSESAPCISKIHNYIEEHETSGDVHSIRVKDVLNVFETLQKGNRGKAITDMEEAIDRLYNQKYLYNGEVLFCIKQLKKIRLYLLRDNLTELDKSTNRLT